MLPSVTFIAFLITNALGVPLMEHLKSGPHVRIINGNNATIEANPWQVSLQMFGVHNCGGAIISPDTILTAAHCCTGLTQLDYEVVAGTTDLSQAATRVPISKAIIHELHGYDYDIAILKLDVSLNYDDRIQSAALPEREVTSGEILKFTGWGKSNILQSVDVEIVDQQTCIKEYENYTLTTSRMICAGRVGGGNYVDQGDDGGPLTKDGILYGIASHGKDGSPYVYTNVVALLDWIREKAEL